MDQVRTPHLMVHGTPQGESPPVSVIVQLVDLGYTQTEIASMYGVTKQAISFLWRKYVGTLTPRQRLKNSMPWAQIVPDKFQRATALQRLRDHGELMIAGDADRFHKHRISALRKFYKTLQDNDYVVVYDPSIPPNPGIAANGGFDYVKREPRDGDFMVRTNEYANPTEYGDPELWRFPPPDL